MIQVISVQRRLHYVKIKFRRDRRASRRMAYSKRLRVKYILKTNFLISFYLKSFYPVALLRNFFANNFWTDLILA